MTNYFLIYDDCCFYEIVLLGYFLKYSEQEIQNVKYCAAENREIRTTEGFLVTPDVSFNDIPAEDVRALIIPGGAIENVMSESLNDFLSGLNREMTFLGAICAGVTLLEQYGFLDGKTPFALLMTWQSVTECSLQHVLTVMWILLWKWERRWKSSGTRQAFQRRLNFLSTIKQWNHAKDFHYQIIRALNLKSYSEPPPVRQTRDGSLYEYRLKALILLSCQCQLAFSASRRLLHRRNINQRQFFRPVLHARHKRCRCVEGG